MVANISYTRFIRTTDEDHRKAVQHLWNALVSKGMIKKDIYKGYYAVSDECFYTKSQVFLKDGRYHSIETGNLAELTQEENYTFPLSTLGKDLDSFYNSQGLQTIIPKEQHDSVVKEIQDGLGDLSISRPRSRIRWGIPVPSDPEHTIYVWVDALMNYLTATGYPWSGADITSGNLFWPPDVQVIGKDIVRFHAIYLPAILASLGIPTAKKILVHPHWTVERRKMSKSVGNVINPFQVMEEQGVDVVRFYLARVGGSFESDHDWSDSQLNKHSGELRSVLGNLYSRTHSTAVMSRFPDYVRQRTSILRSVEAGASWSHDIVYRLSALGSQVDRCLVKFEPGNALNKIVEQLNSVNAMLSEIQPWNKGMASEDGIKAIALSSEALRICGIVLQPFIPAKASELLDALGVPPGEREWRHSGWLEGSASDYESGKVLFPRTPISK